MEKLEVLKFIATKCLSGRFISTLLFVSTYCLCILAITIGGVKLLWGGNELGEKVLVYIIGNLTGTVIGAVVAYHFKKKEEV